MNQVTGASCRTHSALVAADCVIKMASHGYARGVEAVTNHFGLTYLHMNAEPITRSII